VTTWKTFLLFVICKNAQKHGKRQLLQECHVLLECLGYWSATCVVRLSQLTKCIPQSMELVAQCARVNITSHFADCRLVGMTVNGYNDPQAVVASCVGFQTQWAHATVIALRHQSHC